MKIIPAIDIIDGKCVRLSQGDYTLMKTYAANPVEVARIYESRGIKRLHLVDLDGARADHIVNLNVLEKIAHDTDLIIDFGGGIKSDKDISDAFNAGASMVTGGSIAVKHPEVFEQWLKQYGPDRIILGADIKNGKIAVGGWTETSDQNIFGFLDHYVDKAVKFVICTDVARDGVMTGPSIDLYREIMKNFPKINLVASGGVSSIEDVEELYDIGVWGVIIGKAIYEEKIRLEELERFVN